MDNLEQTVLTVAKQLEGRVDDEITRLDNLDDKELQAIRRRRAEELKRRAASEEEWTKAGHGEYSELTEKDFFQQVKASDRVVCHFYRDNWPCKVMDKHMGILCKRHIETRFTKVHAEKAPFLAERLRIKVLPTLALIRKGKVEDYVVGFDELGGTDDFDAAVLESRLARAEVLFSEEGTAARASKQTSVSKGVAFQKTASDEDSDFDD